LQASLFEWAALPSYNVPAALPGVGLFQCACANKSEKNWLDLPIPENPLIPVAGLDGAAGLPAPGNVGYRASKANCYAVPYHN